MTYRVDLTDLSLPGRSIFWGFAYQIYAESLYQEVYITSKYDNQNVYIKVYNGHDSQFTIPILCVAFCV